MAATGHRGHWHPVFWCSLTQVLHGQGSMEGFSMHLLCSFMRSPSAGLCSQSTVCPACAAARIVTGQTVTDPSPITSWSCSCAAALHWGSAAGTRDRAGWEFRSRCYFGLWVAQANVAPLLWKLQAAIQITHQLTWWNSDTFQEMHLFSKTSAETEVTFLTHSDSMMCFLFVTDLKND